MAFGDEWERSRPARGSALAGAGMGMLRVALLFGSAAVALALILTPVAERQTERLYSSHPAGLDLMPTGSIGNGVGAGTLGQRSAHSYTVRRSVLQPSPNSVCVIRQNGMRTGDC